MFPLELAAALCRLLLPASAPDFAAAFAAVLVAAATHPSKKRQLHSLSFFSNPLLWTQTKQWVGMRFLW